MLPHKYHIRLNGQEKQALRQLKHNGKTERRLAARAPIILWTADWVAVDEINTRLGLHRTTVIFWRQRFVEDQQQGRPVVERLRDRPRSGRPAQCTAAQVAQIKAVACEQPAKLALPLSRFSLSEIALWIEQAAIVATISASTILRLLHQDAIRPWYYRGWLFPRDPDFVAKASVILDLYQRRWHGQPLGPHDYVLSADEKSALQVLARPHPTLPPCAGRPGRCEFEYVRNDTLAYLAALDVGSEQVFGRIDATTGIVPFNNWSIWSCNAHRMRPLNASSGSSTAARRIIRAHHRFVYRRPIRTSLSCIRRRMPAG